MPTYDYECEACNHHFERWQEMSARKLRTCPECGKRKLVRLVGAGAGVIFRGSGFYETDYKRKQQPRPANADASSGSSKSSSSDSSGSSDSKRDGGSSSTSSSGKSGGSSKKGAKDS